MLCRGSFVFMEKSTILLSSAISITSLILVWCFIDLIKTKFKPDWEGIPYVTMFLFVIGWFIFGCALFWVEFFNYATTI